MGFTRAFNRRTTPSDIPGFAGGTLQDELNRQPDEQYGWGMRFQQPQPSAPVLTPQNQEAITRPRTVTQSPQSDQQDATYSNGQWSGVEAARPRTFAGRLMQPQETVDMAWPATQANDAQVTTQEAARPRSVAPNFADRFMKGTNTIDPAKREEIDTPFGSSNAQLGGGASSRPRWSGPRDYVADDSQYLRDIESKPLTLRDKAGLVAQNIATNLGGKPLPTRRQREIERATGQLGRDVAIQKEQTAQDMSRMVPITDQGGNIIGYSPARTAAGTQVHATDAASRLTETKRRNDAYIGHVNDLPKEKQAEAARKMYQAGIADGNPELKSELARRMGLKEELPDSDKGSIQTDAQGNFIVVHPRNASAVDVTQPTTTPEGVTTKTPVGSFKQTQEDNKDTRLQKRQVFEREMKALDRAAAEKRARIMVQGAASRLGDADEYGTMADKLDDEANASDATNTPTGRRSAVRLRALSNQNRVLASKARSAQGGVGAQAAPSQSSGAKLDVNIALQRAATKKRSALTPDEEQKVRAEVDRRNKNR